MAEVRTFATLKVASAITGFALCQTSFSEIHEITEFLAGHPVWTHELGNMARLQPIRDAAYAQFPDMPTYAEAKADWRAAAAKAVAAYGETVEVRQGSLGRDADPLTTLREMTDKPVVTDAVKKEAQS